MDGTVLNLLVNSLFCREKCYVRKSAVILSKSARGKGEVRERERERERERKRERGDLSFSSFPSHTSCLEIKDNERLQSIIQQSLQPVENPDTVLFPSRDSMAEGWDPQRRNEVDGGDPQQGNDCEED